MSRMVGTVSRGIRAPIIREGDNLVDIAVNSVLEAAQYEGFAIRDKDVISLTESIVARAQGNYASVDDIAETDIPPKVEHIISIDSNMLKNFLPFIQNPP